MVAMNRKYRNSNIDIRILVIDMSTSALKCLTSITQDLEFAWLLSVAIVPQTFYDLIHCFSGRLVVVEQVAG